MFADTGIASGHATAADVLFLIAAILAVITAALTWRPAIDTRIFAVGWLAITCLAVGFLVL